jgi:hypothetical protein
MGFSGVVATRIDSTIGIDSAFIGSTIRIDSAFIDSIIGSTIAVSTPLAAALPIDSAFTVVVLLLTHQRLLQFTQSPLRLQADG